MLIRPSPSPIRTVERMSVIHVDGEPLDVAAYQRMHDERINRTIALLRELGCRRIVELGSHPWVMTTALLEKDTFELAATVSAEEAVAWPDDPEVCTSIHNIQSPRGRQASIKNYSFNIERRLIHIEERPDTILACEIIEHLVRSPHVMLLNANNWLDVGGYLVLTTPNGSQFMNPLKLAPRMPAYRARCYERHAYVYRRCDLIELIELCGFSIERAGFWSPYPAAGSQRVYRLLARLPGAYCPEKFHRTIYVVARKERDVQVLERAPRVYVPSSHWEHIQDCPGPRGHANAVRGTSE